MKKIHATNLNFSVLKIKSIYKIKNTNILKRFVYDNLEDIDELNNMVKELLKRKWIYIKNKDIYYNTDLCALFPNLLTFVIGFCPIREKFNDSSVKLKFGQYCGRIMTDTELLKIMDSKGCVQNIEFYNYTVFLNGIKFIDKNNLNKINNFNNKENPYLSYHIPIYDLIKNKKIMDNNGYDLKYIDEGIRIKNLCDVINLWFDYELIPAGLSEEKELLYCKLMELSKIKYYTTKYRNIKTHYVKEEKIK